jgi:hypothetical protein
MEITGSPEAACNSQPSPFPYYHLMTAPEQIVCKPTPWFALRAVAMLVMFSVFAVLFYIDGTTGYRKKNLEFYLHGTFQKASDTFAKMENAEGDLTAAEWKEFAQSQEVGLPDDAELVPAGTEIPMPWPEILTNYERMKPLQPHLLWQEYSGEMKMSSKVKEEAITAEEIGEQIIVFYICLSLSLITMFFLVRTMRRSVRADDSSLTTATGKNIPYEAMKTLDLRKWDTKGIALIDYEGPSGTARARIDGLTYGGFKKEQDEPAERLMRKVRENFSGEIIEYAAVEAEPKSDENSEEA